MVAYTVIYNQSRRVFAIAMNIFQVADALVRQRFYLALSRPLQQRMTAKSLEKTVREAYHNVPYYRDAFDNAGVNIAEFTARQLKRLPLLDKQTVQRNFPERMVARDADLDKAIHHHTSGSTGRPLTVVQTAKTYTYCIAQFLRVFTMVGYKPWYRISAVTYSDFELPKYSLGPFFRINFVRSYEDVKIQVEQLMEQKPDLLMTFPSCAMKIARYIQQHPQKRLSLSMVSVNSELCTAEDKAFIAKYLECPVYDEYSTYETSVIACQCRAGNYHIFSDNVLVEIVNEDGSDAAPGKVGEVVLTTLRNPLMPFIRYRIGDLAYFKTGTCECGSRLPMLGGIEGRLADQFTMPDGQKLLPSLVVRPVNNFLVKHPGAVLAYKVRQVSHTRIEIFFIPGENYDASANALLITDIGRYMHPEVEVHVEVVDELPNQGVKFKLVESLV